MRAMIVFHPDGQIKSIFPIVDNDREAQIVRQAIQDLMSCACVPGIRLEQEGELGLMTVEQPMFYDVADEVGLEGPG